MKNTIQEFQYKDQTFVVKIGGNALAGNKNALTNLAKNIAILCNWGIKVVIMHGGGPNISKALNANGIQTEFVDGYRKTPPEAMPLIAEELNKISENIKHAIDQVFDPLNTGKYTSKRYTNFGSAVILSTRENPIFYAKKKYIYKNNNKIDLGSVGDIIDIPKELKPWLYVNPYTVIILNSIAALYIDTEDVGLAKNTPPKELLNINADAAASVLAKSLNADKLIFLTDVDGIYASWPDKNSFIETIDLNDLERLKPSLSEGMIPKAQGAIDYVSATLRTAHILNGCKEDILINKFLYNIDSGTSITYT